MESACPLCGHRFDPETENCHAGCPLSKNCAMIKCPHCGYEYVEESKTVSFVKRLFKKKNAAE